MTFLVLAFGGGVLLASMIGGSSRRSVIATPENQNGKPSGGGLRDTQVSESWANLKGALIGLAGAKVRDALSEALLALPNSTRRWSAETPRQRPVRRHPRLTACRLVLQPHAAWQ